jgi:glycosyltransferase involved in cell wall biosynthesis
VHLIYIGKLRIDCNLLSLCRAVELANVQGMAFVLSLVGEGPERPTLEEFARLTDGRIRVQRPVPHDQIPDLLRQAHVGVTALPSPGDRLFGASSPVKLFEYLAAGLPVLSTRNPCHVEAVAQGTYAFWAENESEEDLFGALSQVWQARSTLRERGREAAISARAWTWEESAKKLGAALKCGLGIQGL